MLKTKWTRRACLARLAFGPACATGHELEFGLVNIAPMPMANRNGPSSPWSAIVRMYRSGEPRGSISSSSIITQFRIRYEAKYQRPFEKRIIFNPRHSKAGRTRKSYASEARCQSLSSGLTSGQNVQRLIFNYEFSASTKLA